MELRDMIISLVTNPLLDADILRDAKKNYSKLNKISWLPSNMQMLKTYRDLLDAWEISQHKTFEQMLKKRAIRSQSGIVSVQVLTKPFRCPGKCIFCPNDFTMPKSYINTEPGAMRALLNNFDPIKQVYNRLLSLTLTGHDTDKIEMIVLGGTRDVYPNDYKEQFIKWLYDACNTFPEFYKRVSLTIRGTKSLYAIEDAKTENKSEDSIQSLVSSTDVSQYNYPTTIEESILRNETATQRIIGLTVETRPEYVTHENCQFWRKLGVTRLEMGIQSTNDEVLEKNKRGHTTEQSRQACHLLRQYGFKFSVHLMPGLYGSDPDKDLQTFKDVYSDPYFKPDEIKFYPTSVIPNTELYDLYQQGKYKPIETEAIKDIITTTFRDIIPPYTRIKRLIRDIPSTEIAAGSSVTNLAQLMHEQLYKQWRNTDIAKWLYGRLFDHYTQYPSLDDYLSSEQIWERNIQTTIIGEISPDLQSDRAFVSLDTRSREIRHRHIPLVKGGVEGDSSEKHPDAITVIRHYASSLGDEFFISIETSQGYLYGFTRLVLPREWQTVDYPWLGAWTALIRELHVYGQLAWLNKESQKIQREENTDFKEDQITKIPNHQTTKTQHTGVGKSVMAIAEQIATHSWYQRLSVIAGIGVRDYYRKLGYDLEWTYMVKKLRV